MATRIIVWLSCLFRYLSQAGTHIESRRHGRWWASLPQEQWVHEPGGIQAAYAALQESSAVSRQQRDGPRVCNHTAVFNPKGRGKRKAFWCRDCQSVAKSDSALSDERETRFGGAWGKEDFGDRFQNLVFIGMNLERKAIETLLDRCLLTDSELPRYMLHQSEPNLLC